MTTAVKQEPLWLNRVFIFAFAFQAVFFVNYIVVDSTALTRVAAVLGMGLPLLILLAMGPARAMMRDTTSLLLLAMVAYLACSMLWADGLDADEFYNVTRKLILFPCTMLATIWIYSYRPDALDWMLRIIGGAAVLAALAAAAVNSEAFFSAQRLTGLGGLGNELDAGIAFGAGALVWLHFYRLEHKPVYILLGAITVLAMLSTLSRSVVVAWIVGLCVYRLALSQRMPKLELIVGVGFLAAVLAATWWLRPEGSIQDSCRVDLFTVGWQQFLESPLQGNGIRRFYRIEACDKIFNGSHNIVLEVLRYAGMIGLGLFIALLGSIGHKYRRMTDREVAAPLLMLVGFGWTMMLVNGQFIAVGPRLPWLVVWMPLMAITGLALAQQRKMAELK